MDACMHMHLSSLCHGKTECLLQLMANRGIKTGGMPNIYKKFGLITVPTIKLLENKTAECSLLRSFQAEQSQS